MQRSVLVLVLVIMWVGSLPQAAEALAEPANLCAVLLMDNSGSMEANDPGYLRNTAARLFVSLLEEEDKVGIIRFSNHIEALTEGLTQVVSVQDRLALIERIQNVPPDGATDVLAALETAGKFIANQTCGARALVLLTDGKAELPGGLPAGYGEQMITVARDINVPVYGVALTTAAESSLLMQLSQATEDPGMVIPASSAADLIDAYLSVFSRLKDRTVLSIDFQDASRRADFFLDPVLAPYIHRATFIAVRPEMTQVDLIGPENSPISPKQETPSYSFVDDPQFQVYSIPSPPPGDWSLRFSGTETVQVRAILRSRLRVRLIAPPAYHPVGQPMLVAARLVEESEDGVVKTLIGEGSLSAAITRPDGSQDLIDRLYDDGTHGDQQALDGVFSHLDMAATQPGEHRIYVHGYKGMIPVSQTGTVRVVPFPKLVIDAPTSSTQTAQGSPLSLMLHLEGGDPPTLERGSFVAAIRDPLGQEVVVPLAWQNGQARGEWIPSVGGSHEITFSVEDGTYKGIPYQEHVTRQVEIRQEVFVKWVPAMVDFGKVFPHDLTSGQTLQAKAISSTAQTMPVRYQFFGLPSGITAHITPGLLLPGENSLVVKIQGTAPPGNYQAVLLVMYPVSLALPPHEIPIHFEVLADPAIRRQNELLESLERGRIWGLGGLLAVIAVWGYLWSRPRPWGTLYPVRTPMGLPVLAPIRLSAVRPGIFSRQIHFSSTPNAQIRLVFYASNPYHVSIGLARMAVAEKIGKPARVVVRQKLVHVVKNHGKNLILVDQGNVAPGQQSAALRSGSRIVIGPYEFEYRG